MRLGSHTTATATSWRWSTARLLTAFVSSPLPCAAGRCLERHRRTRKPLAVARPKLLARNADRVFYRRFCNIVGDVRSPLLANISLHVLDMYWAQPYSSLGHLTRYA